MDFIEARELSFSQLNEAIRRAGKECRICALSGAAVHCRRHERQDAGH